MASVEQNIPRRSKTRAWGNAIAITVLLVVLIQIFQVLAGHSAPSTGSHPFVVREITSIAIAEIITLFAVYKLLRADHRSMRSVGLWKRATAMSWIFGIGLGLLTAFWGLSNPALQLHSKLGALLDPSPWHLYSSLCAGIVGGFCEEIIFRGFIIQELATAGHARWVQVLGSAILFGIAHAALLRGGIIIGLLVIVPTAVLGALYAVIYLLGKRSLMPVIASHFLNDVAVIPWVFLLAATRSGH